MYLVFSTSLHPESRSRIMANVAFDQIKESGQPCELIDLACIDPLPHCNGHDCYSHPEVTKIANEISAAKGILIASPVYNFDVSASCKNLIELTGRVWTDKVVGVLCAAGGQSSYMAPVGLFNSLMLDFRCLMLPKFVYAREDCFEDNKLCDDAIEKRISDLVQQLLKVASCLGR